jgi:hypothetical protein
VTGKTLALIVVVPFLLMAGIGYWLTQVDAPAAPPPAPPAAPIASARTLFGKGAKEAVAPGAAGQLAPPNAVRLAPASEPSRTPLTDSLTRALADARPTATVTPGEPPEPQGAVSKEDVRAAIDAVKPLVKQCFEDAAARNPGPQKVTLSFTIQGQGLTGYLKDGEVSESTIQDPFLQACFLEAVADAKFPPPHGGGVVKITYPFRFQPAEDAGP